MSLKTVLILSAIVSGFFAVVTLLIPAIMLSSYGVESNEATLFMTRFFGTGLLVIALISFYLKDAELIKEVKSVMLALIISDAVAFIVALWAQIANIFNSLGWLTVIIYLFFTIALYSVHNKK